MQILRKYKLTGAYHCSEKKILKQMTEKRKGYARFGGMVSKGTEALTWHVCVSIKDSSWRKLGSGLE